MKKDNYSIIDIENLTHLAHQNREDYQINEPFPHATFDEVYSPQILDAVIEEFHNSQHSWRDFDTKYEKKSQQCDERLLGPTTRQLIHNLNSSLFLNFLEELTGITGLIPDPYLVGGGLHKISRGGKLGIHVDFNKHKRMHVFRRINIIIYLNKDWKEEYGGHLELWDKQTSKSVKKILPVFNRMAIFNTTSKSFHGHPEPLACPEEMNRMSLALYYYTANEPGNRRKIAHSTLFLNDRNEARSLGHQSLIKRLLKRCRRFLASTKS